MNTVRRTVSTSWSRSTCDQRSPQISPRRIPVVILTQTNAPQSGSARPGTCHQPSGLLGAWRLRVGVRHRRLVCLLGDVRRNPLPHHGSVKSPADDPVHLPYRRVRQSTADVPLAQPGRRPGSQPDSAACTVPLDARRTGAHGWCGAEHGGGGCSGRGSGGARRRTSPESPRQAGSAAPIQATVGCAYRSWTRSRASLTGRRPELPATDRAAGRQSRAYGGFAARRPGLATECALFPLGHPHAAPAARPR